MAAGIADYGTAAWLSALFGVTADITGYYVALCSGEPGVASDGTILAELEPSDGAYARQAYGVGDTNWAVNGNAITNLLELDYGIPSIDWGLITHYALCNALTGGDLYGWGEFVSAQFVSAQYLMVIPPGGIVVSLAPQDNSVTV